MINYSEMKNVISKSGKLFVSLMLALFIVSGMLFETPALCMYSYASVTGEVRIIVSKTQAYTNPDIDSEVILDLEIGDSVFVTGEEGDYYSIYYKELTGYVPKYAIDGTEAPSAFAGASVNPDAADLAASYLAKREELDKAVEKELKEQEAYNEFVEDYIDQQTTAKRNKAIWISVIVVLSLSMIAVGVISVIQGNKKEE